MALNTLNQVYFNSNDSNIRLLVEGVLNGVILLVMIKVSLVTPFSKGFLFFSKKLVYFILEK